MSNHFQKLKKKNRNPLLFAYFPASFCKPKVKMLFLSYITVYPLDLLLQEIQSKATVPSVKSRIYNLSVPKEKCEGGVVKRSEEFGV